MLFFSRLFKPQYFLMQNKIRRIKGDDEHAAFASVDKQGYFHTRAVQSLLFFSLFIERMQSAFEIQRHRRSYGL